MKPKYFVMWIAFWLAFSTAVIAANDDSPFEGRHQVKPLVYTECQAGHVFVIAASQYGTSIMQVFQDAGDMVPKPIECGKDAGRYDDDE